MNKEIEFKYIVIKDLGKLNLFVGKTELLLDLDKTLLNLLRKERQKPLKEQVDWSWILWPEQKRGVPLHYSEMKDWIEGYLDYYNQLTFITQSLDFIKAFVQVAQEKNETDIRLFRLEEYEDGSLDAIPYRLENILSSLERHLAFR